MPPKSKRRGLKSIFAGLGSLFCSSKGGPRDEEPFALDMSTVEGSRNNVHGSALLGDSEGSTTGAATTGMGNSPEEIPPSHFGVDSSTAERARGHPPLTEHTPSMSMFTNAQKLKIDSVNVNVHSSQHVHSTHDSWGKGWKMLMKNIASNALHDSSARFDAPKCDEDTRVEVTNELMDWIQDREAPKRLLCMTGAAGAGKSALQQTTAEKCSKSNILGSAFFFAAADPTRNNLTRIVPTIACQLGLRNSALRDAMARAIEEDPLIFKKKIKIQMDTLVVAPFKHVCASRKLDRNTFPHAILIDGLDECSGEENQAELLSTIKYCLLDNDLPFRIFIASRPEWAIRSALESEPEGYLYQLTYHIKLSDMYDATGDIRRYLWSRLRTIGSRSHDRRAQSHLWPTKEDIERIVAAASGQFVYAATVVKYLSERRSSPVDRLRTIIESILSVAKELYEKVDTYQGRDFLLLVRAHQMNSDYRISNTQDGCDNFDEILGLEEGGHQVLFSDLHSLVFFQGSGIYEEMRFYHLSFSEFLDSEFRAQQLFVSELRVQKYITESCLQNLLHREDFLDSWSFSRIIGTLARYSDCQATHVDDSQLIDFTRNNGWGRIDERLSFHVSIGRGPLTTYWHPLASFTIKAIQRLRDELREHELADIVKSYFDKWKERYRKHGFTEEEEKEEEEWEEEGEGSTSSH